MKKCTMILTGILSLTMVSPTFAGSTHSLSDGTNMLASGSTMNSEELSEKEQLSDSILYEYIGDDQILNGEDSEKEKDNNDILKDTIIEDISVDGFTETIDDAVMNMEDFEERVNQQVLALKEEKKKGINQFRYLADEDNDGIEPYLYVDESEPNDTISKADRVYTDRSIFGFISKSGDIDYFKIKPTLSGYATILLKNIPEGCDYDFYVVNSEDETIKAANTSSGTTEELVMMFTAGVTYYIRVEGYENTDYDPEGEYILRISIDSSSKEYAFCVGAVYPGAVDSTEEVDYAAEAALEMGYDPVICNNPTKSGLESTLERGKYNLEASIVFLAGHGSPDCMFWNHAEGTRPEDISAAGVSSKFNYASDMGLQNDGIQYTRLKDYNLKQCRLMMFEGCECAAESEYAANSIAEYAHRRGVQTSVGWESVTRTGDCIEFAKLFFPQLANGKTVAEAIQLALDNGQWERYYEISTVKIFGDYSNILRLEDKSPNGRNSEDLEDLSLGKRIIVDAANNDFTQLENVIYDIDCNFNDSVYDVIVNQWADNLYFVFYDKYIDGFETGTVYSALIEDNQVKHLYRVQEDAIMPLVEDIPIEVTDEMKNSAIELAKDELPEGYSIVEQRTVPVIRNGKYCLSVQTDYNISIGDFTTTEYESFLYEIPM